MVDFYITKLLLSNSLSPPPTSEWSQFSLAFNATLKMAGVLLLHINFETYTVLLGKSQINRQFLCKMISIIQHQLYNYVINFISHEAKEFFIFMTPKVEANY